MKVLEVDRIMGWGFYNKKSNINRFKEIKRFLFFWIISVTYRQTFLLIFLFYVNLILGGLW